MIVVDASAVIDALLDPPAAPHLVEIVSGAVGPLAAPVLIDIEVMSVLRRFERAREIGEARARRALAWLRELPIELHLPREIAARAWALRHNLSAYDAQYVALAQVLDAELLTTDAGMADAARRIGVSVVDVRG